jgi:hypothetical protein
LQDPVQNLSTGFIERIGVSQFDAQPIPLDKNLRDLDKYKAFLTARRLKIAECLNAYIGTQHEAEAR